MGAHTQATDKQDILLHFPIRRMRATTRGTPAVDQDALFEKQTKNLP